MTIDHIALALARLPHQYRGADPEHETNTQKAIRALLAPAAALEATMQQVLRERSVDTAIGVQLEAIGNLVGRPREGVLDDEIYRRYIKAQISANKSDGLISDMLTIARLVVGPGPTLVLRNEGAACFVLSVDGAITDEVAAVLMEMLIRAASGGVRPILEYSTEAPEDVLRWSDPSTVWGTAVWARAADKEF